MYRPVMVTEETWARVKRFSLNSGRSMKSILSTAVDEYISRESTPEARIRAALSQVYPDDQLDSAVSEAMARLATGS